MKTSLPARPLVRAVATVAFLGLLSGLPALAATPVQKKMATEPIEVRVVDPATYVAGKEFDLIILGRGFSEDERTKVLIGDLEAKDVRVQSPRRISVTVPATAKPGCLSVTVINPSKEKATLESALYLRSPEGGFSLGAMFHGIRADWRGFSEWYRLGGPVMHPILLLSFVGVAWAVHCFLVLRRSQIMPPKFMEALSSYLAQGDLKGATATCEKTSCVFGRVILAGLRKSAEAPEKVREAINAAGSRESAHLHQKISYLANVGVIEPMLGLLGTVLGMIMAFNVISSGDVRHYLLAAALAQAMITTAAGLIVGIPAMAVYFYLRGRVLRLTTHMEVVADEVAQTVIEKGGEE